MSSMEKFRQRVAEIGKDATIIEEMIRLGFISQQDLAEGKVKQSEIKAVLDDLKPTLEELNKVQNQIYELGDLESLIKQIRTERIALVKAKREEKKIAKEKARVERQEEWELAKRTKAPFLGVGVSARLTFGNSDVDKLKSRNLPILENISDIADAMEFSVQDLIWLCYERATTNTDHYSRFEIPKRNGGTRLISSPKPKMRVAQSWINSKILDNLNPSKYSYAFAPNISIVDNAKQHLNKKIIVKLDIKDFFPTITFTRVRGYFEYLGYNPGVATVLALISTDSPKVRVTIKGVSNIVSVGPRSLPQGACTSPKLANMIASRLDSRIAGLLLKLPGQWVYTRYADDLTFSSENELAEIGQLIAAVKRISSDEKFEVKNEKTRIMRYPSRQTVTGLVVEKDVRIKKESLRRIRALFHNIETKGKDQVSEDLGKNALNVAKGYWAFLYMVMPDLAAKYRAKYKWLA